MVLLAARFISEQPTIQDLLANQGKFSAHLIGTIQSHAYDVMRIRRMFKHGSQASKVEQNSSIT